jgi:hypothetical protein
MSPYPSLHLALALELAANRLSQGLVSLCTLRYEEALLSRVTQYPFARYGLSEALQQAVK